MNCKISRDYPNNQPKINIIVNFALSFYYQHMQILQATELTLQSILRFLEQVDQPTYSKPLEVFNGSSLGGHTRHIIEFYHCLIKNYQQGTINYDLRERDKNIENDPELAAVAVQNIIVELAKLSMEKPVELQVSYDLGSDNFDSVTSNVKREVIYNLEHTIHHMALIKIGVKVAAPHIELEHEFGVAPSTIKFQQSTCAQ
jgi:hypothetical protein